MKIKIKDISMCLNCKTNNCQFCNSEVNVHFHELKSESTVCPTNVFSNGILEVEKIGYISSKKCIGCGLCILHCAYNNLEAESFDIVDSDFDNLSDKQYNAMASLYLNTIFSFAANTNRNKSLNFDGYLTAENGMPCFVEIDYLDDSLECVRRLLSDFLLYSPSNDDIRTGLIVLKTFPKSGSREVYNLMQSIKKFPRYKECGDLFCDIFIAKNFLCFTLDFQSHINSKNCFLI